MMLNKVIKHFFQSKAKYSIILIAIGSFVWSLTMIRSGITYPFGMGFWGPNAHDGIWHIALAEGFARRSWQVPIFSGYTIKNYHIGFDLLLAYLHKITQIPIPTLYFQILPPIFAILIGYLAYKLIYSWTKSESSAFWSLFFIYFGGGWGWVISIIRDHSLGGDSMFWAQSAATTLINPPFALSIIVLFGGLILLQVYTRKRRTYVLFLASVLFALLIQIKVYAGIVALGGFFLSGLYKWVIDKDRTYLIFFIPSFFISIIILCLTNKNPSSVIVFYPFWFLETLMGFADRLNWPRFNIAIINYKASSNYLKLALSYLVALIIFLFGNLGTRAVGMITLYKRDKVKKENQWLYVFIATIIILGILLPMVFIQKGTSWNTIQFFYYSLLFSGILAGIAVSNILKKLSGIKYYGFIILMILLTIPTTLSTLRHYTSLLPHSNISHDELNALSFLRDQENGIVLSTQLFERKNLEKESIPIDLYKYESTAYVSAFSSKPVYFEDEINLDIMGYNWQQRKDEIVNFLKDTNSESGKKFLKDNKIIYIYEIKSPGVGLHELTLNLENIYDNEEVIVYRVLSSK